MPHGRSEVSQDALTSIGHRYSALNTSLISSKAPIRGGCARRIARPDRLFGLRRIGVVRVGVVRVGVLWVGVLWVGVTKG
jgi:hypothetical protein